MSADLLTVEQTRALSYEIHKIIFNNKSAQDLLKHDPVFHKIVNLIRDAKSRRQPITIPGLASLLCEISQAYYRTRVLFDKQASEQQEGSIPGPLGLAPEAMLKVLRTP